MSKHVTLSRHAQVRMQQRGIPELMATLIQCYGDREEAHEGCNRVSFSRKRLESIRIQMQEVLARMDRLANAYLVESADGLTVVTMGHRHRSRSWSGSAQRPRSRRIRQPLPHMTRHGHEA